MALHLGRLVLGVGAAQTHVGGVAGRVVLRVGGVHRATQAVVRGVAAGTGLHIGRVPASGGILITTSQLGQRSHAATTLTDAAGLDRCHGGGLGVGAGGLLGELLGLGDVRGHARASAVAAAPHAQAGGALPTLEVPAVAARHGVPVAACSGGLAGCVQGRIRATQAEGRGERGDAFR